MALYSKVNKLIEQLSHLHKKEVLILLFLTVYAHGIIHSLHCLFEIKKSLFLLNRYIYAESANTKNLKKVLSYYPIIVKYSYQKESMKRSNPDYVNYEIAKQHYSDLLNNWDFFVYDYKKAFNPLVALKATFSIPSSFLNWIGFYPRRINLNFFNQVQSRSSGPSNTCNFTGIPIYLSSFSLTHCYLLYGIVHFSTSSFSRIPLLLLQK